MKMEGYVQAKELKMVNAQVPIGAIESGDAEVYTDEGPYYLVVYKGSSFYAKAGDMEDAFADNPEALSNVVKFIENLYYPGVSH